MTAVISHIAPFYARKFIHRIMSVIWSDIKPISCTWLFPTKASTFISPRTMIPLLLAASRLRFVGSIVLGSTIEVGMMQTSDPESKNAHCSVPLIVNGRKHGIRGSSLSVARFRNLNRLVRLTNGRYCHSSRFLYLRNSLFVSGNPSRNVPCLRICNTIRSCVTICWTWLDLDSTTPG